MPKIYNSVAESYLLPDLISLESNLYSAKFYLMKLIPAKFIIEESINSNIIDTDTVIIESTSGTFGLALALVCQEYQLKLVLVSDPAIDHDLENRLIELGAEVIICTEASEKGGYQEARLKILKQEMKKYPKAFCPSQYSNEMNPGSYSIFAEQLITHFGSNIDYLVGSVGSGGSMSGTLSALRSLNPSIKGVAVDSSESMLFGRVDAGSKRVIRGLGNSILPPNLNHALFDQIHWLSSNEIVNATRRLHKKYGLFCGPTSGATYAVANYLAKENPDKNIVFICADGGYRYYNDIYSEDWVKKQSFNIDNSSETIPREVNSPREFGNEDWCFMNWDRKYFFDDDSFSSQLAKG